MTRYNGPIRSTMNPATHRPVKRPYDRLRDIERRARAGEHITDRQEATVNLEPIEPKIIPRKESTHPWYPDQPRSYGQIIADQLLNHDDPMGVMIRATGATRNELRNAQQSGTRWLGFKKRRDLRLSYRRTGMDEVVWFLTEKQQAGESAA